MHQPRRLRLTASIMLCFVLQALGADKYTDENRPYEFGFKIDGQQHRHESKDKDGIIMGEFGFITADDVYHVTVYATDKEGRFKILSMKNIHLKSSSSSFGAPTSARQGHALALPPAQAASVKASAFSQEPQKLGGVSTPAHLGPFTPQAPVSQVAFASQPGKPSKPVSIEPPGRACSSCSLPTTTTQAPPPAYNQVPGNNNYNGPNQFGTPGSSSQNQQGFPASSPGQQNIAQGGPSGSSYNPQGGQQAFPPLSPRQQNTAERGPNSSSYSPQGGQQAFHPSSPGQQNTAQGGPSSSSYSPQGGQQAFHPSSPGQQNTAQGGPSGSSYSPQGGQQAFHPSSHGQQNTAQGGPSGLSYSPQGGQQAFHPSSPGQQNTAQGGPSGLSYSPQGGQQAFHPSSPGQQNTAQGGPSSSSYSPQGGQQAFHPSSPGQQNTARGGPSGSSYSPQGDQRNYPSGQQNILQQGLVAPGGAPSFAPQPGQEAQNYPSSPSYSLGSPNAPNNYAPGSGAFSSPGQTQGGTGNQAGLFGGNNNPYGRAAPSGASTTVPHSGNFGQNNIQQAIPSSYPQEGAGERTAKQYNGPEQQFDSKLGPQGPGAGQGGQRGSKKPTLFSAQMQIVDKNTDVYALGPNEQKGLPPGLSQNDMTQLLYTFNYTVGFHGQFEEGYTNGVKKGYYFVTGRNGVRTRIDYVADDTGFHPKVSQDVLDLLSEDVPKPETEKDEKYGLKGYEFKWLYYPVESKNR